MGDDVDRAEVGADGGDIGGEVGVGAGQGQDGVGRSWK
jgi:hypothetical protein